MKKRRSAAQKAAFRKMISARKRNPIRRRARTSVASRASSPIRRRRRNPIVSSIRRRISRRRRNPLPKMGNIVHSLIQPSAIGAIGALILDIAWAKLPIPANLKTGPAQYVAKGAAAVAIGLLAEKATSKGNAHTLALGAMTITLHDALRAVVKQAMPSLALSEYVGGLGYYNAGWPAGTLDAPNTAAAPMGEYVGEYVGGYDSNGDDAYAGYYYGR